VLDEFIDFSDNLTKNCYLTFFSSALYRVLYILDFGNDMI